MLAVDYYSRYVAAEILDNISTKNTTYHLTKMFAQFGIPNTITSDNGPNLRSREFKEFCAKFGINNFIQHQFGHKQMERSKDRIVRC